MVDTTSPEGPGSLAWQTQRVRCLLRRLAIREGFCNKYACTRDGTDPDPGWTRTFEAIQSEIQEDRTHLMCELVTLRGATAAGDNRLSRLRSLCTMYEEMSAVEGTDAAWSDLDQCRSRILRDDIVALEAATRAAHVECVRAATVSASTDQGGSTRSDTLDSAHGAARAGIPPVG